MPCLTGSPVGADALGARFAGEILPLEPVLTRMLRRHWRRAEDVADLRQEIYIRVYETVGREGLPDSASGYLFATARNHLINKARRARIVQFDLVAELEELPAPRSTCSRPRSRRCRRAAGRWCGSGRWKGCRRRTLPRASASPRARWKSR